MEPRRFAVSELPDAFDGFISHSFGVYTSANGLVKARVSPEWASILGPWCEKKCLTSDDPLFKAALDSDLAIDDENAPSFDGDVVVDEKSITVDFDIDGGEVGDFSVGPDDIFSWSVGQGVFLLIWARALTRTVHPTGPEEDERIETTYSVRAFPMPHEMRFCQGLSSRDLAKFVLFYAITGKAITQAHFEIANGPKSFETYDAVPHPVRMLNNVIAFEANMVAYPTLVSLFLADLDDVRMKTRPGYFERQQLPDFIYDIPVLSRKEKFVHYCTKASMFLFRLSNAALRFADLPEPQSTGAALVTNFTTFMNKPQGWIGWPKRVAFEFAGHTVSMFSRYASYIMHVPFKAAVIGPSFMKKDFLSSFKGTLDVINDLERKFAAMRKRPEDETWKGFFKCVLENIKSHAWFVPSVFVAVFSQQALMAIQSGTSMFRG